MSYIDVTGKTEDEAIRKALAQLGMDRDDVSVEILERAKSGFLGLGGNPARVRVTYTDAEETVAVEPVKEEVKAAPVKEERSEKKVEKSEKKAEKKQVGTNENGRLGNRPYARGRAFSEDHYAD